MGIDKAPNKEEELEPVMNMGRKGPTTLRTLSPFIAGVLLVIIFIMSMVSIYDNGRIIIDIPNMTGVGVVKGTVTDRNDTGLEDAMISVKSTDIFVYSDVGGNFSIENCPQGIQTITFYKRGFAPRDIDVLVTGSGYEFPPIMLPDLWEELTKREKLLLAATVSANTSGSKHFSISLFDITQILVSHRISLLEVELAKASADLARRQLIFLEDGGNRIRIEDSLFGRWIAVNQDIELINSQEEYDVGEALRKLGDGLSRSFKMGNSPDAYSVSSNPCFISNGAPF